MSLGLAMLLAVGLTDIAHRSFASGLMVLATVLVARWLLSSALGEWSAHASRSIKLQWRSRTVSLMRMPRLEGERGRGDVALAIEHAADGPSLELLATSARLSPLGLILVFWSVGWLSTLITVGLMALAVPLYQRAGKRSEVLAAEFQERRTLLEGRQLELLDHAPELRALGAVNYGADEIAAISNSENSIAMRAIRVALESSLVTEFLSGVSIGLVAMVVGFSLLDGHVQLEHALIAVLVTSDIFVSIRRFGSEFHRRENATKSTALLQDNAGPQNAVKGGPLFSAKDLITEACDQAVSFQVGPGDRLLVTGPSGCGKTTLLETLVGWRPPRLGDAEHAVGIIGYVSVESSLLSGSLWDNLALGREVSRDSVVTLLDELGLDAPRFHDLDAMLLADGRGLSSGERVRLALARSLIGGVDVLVLDDIAGVMDEATRDKVRQRLEREERVAIVEATVDAPLLVSPTQHIELAHGR
jgi:ABC-type transport system involved in cytochrome bd biosynthesis fused ATPase/permease subunit